MAPTSPKSAKRAFSDTETLILGQSPRSLRSASSPGKSPSQSPQTPKGKSVKSSPSKSPRLSPSQSSTKCGIASPKVKPVKKLQSKGSLKEQVKACSMMRKSKAAGSPSSSPGCTNKEIEEEKKAKWEETMVEIRSDFDAMKDYNKSHGCKPYSPWSKFLGVDLQNQ